MKHTSKLTIVNDPIYGFISIPGTLIHKLIEHRYFQRLRRISQMGMSYLVYPGAHHTRFHHALGALHLMGRAVSTLRMKGVSISSEEEEALSIAILLHDIGHGPFSHAMEHSIAEGTSHEQISLFFMEALNEEFDGQLSMAIQIFKNEYPRKFMYQLISSQLDMDRMDYLKRDSFYTGVAEGSISSDRLIFMLNVKNDSLVIEEKGIYSVEKFIVARRLMYWQVYLHKTGIVAEQLLVKLLIRAKELTKNREILPGSGPLLYFLNRELSDASFSAETLEIFSRMDDYDIVSAMKMWMEHPDFVLRNISDMLINRELLKIKLQNSPFSEEKVEKKIKKLSKKYDISEHEATYFVFTGHISNQAYSMEKDAINLFTKDGEIVDVATASDQLNLKALSEEVTKFYLCYPKSDY
ncbi:HD domain-containing protein [Aureitalea sp. L0-47]|uniref:HD domain-containing protein n=1 Tax=Aureitalea sp. L0-47 TaxID=2816962 RepID=UPI0022385E1A|nr:HD domain-containing protein [Aureitalea sp. L0-47]MCW5519509.1 HD domain-containing protein [Aureitalea sp. L0-47]